MKNSSSELLKEIAAISHPYLDDLKEKILVILKLHKSLLHVLEKWPNEFETDLLEYCFQFLSFSGKKFTTYRSKRHQLRIICFNYLMRKNLIIRQHSMPIEVDLEFRLLPTRLKFPFGEKSVLGIAICIFLPNSYNHFNHQHVLDATKKILPNVHAVTESFLSIQQIDDPLRFIYLEIEKPDGTSFLQSEIFPLKQYLKEELNKHVETTAPPLFGISDEEEAMKNIAILSRELHTETDIPQLMISYTKTLENCLTFRVILVRAARHQDLSVSEYFQTVQKDFEYVPDRYISLGTIAKSEVSKEACTFYINIPKHSHFLRSNSSFNFIEARQHVLDIITKAFGEVRDYNGGIFAKQRYVFQQFREEFKEFAEKDLECLEDFFHGLNPPEIKVILPLASLSGLFQLYLESKSEDLQKKESFILKTKSKDPFFFFILRYRHPDLEQEMKDFLVKSELSNEFSASLQFKDNKGMTLGYILPNIEVGEKFKQDVQKHLKNWIEKIKNAQIFRLSIQGFPFSLDPRFGGDLLSVSILKMLFEGLMCIGKNEEPEFAVAKSVSISKNGKKYTFKLRKCFWTNGDQITAHDFSYSWKKVLSPDFDSPFVYLFYIVKNAKKAKEGKVLSEKIGVKALDDFTLQVQLEHPYPAFLKCVCLPIFFPVNHRIDLLHPNWPLQKGPSYVSNGPFQLTHSHHPEIYELQKNQIYWDQDQIKLNRIQIIKTGVKRTLEMYNNKELDWAGCPFRLWFPSFSKSQQKSAKELKYTFNYWYLFNTKCFPFQSTKIRQALSLAIDRQAILSKLHFSAQTSFSPLPRCHTQFKIPEIPIEPDVFNAKKLFEEGLKELGIKHSDFPIITLMHDYSELHQEIAALVIKQWKKIFNIEVRLEISDVKYLIKKIINSEFQLTGINWFPLIDDPYYTLNTFKYSEDRINFTSWENEKYKDLLEKSLKTPEIKKRNQYLFEAERILIHEIPLIPLFYESQSFIKNPYLKKLLPSEFYNIDYKKAFFDLKKHV